MIEADKIQQLQRSSTTLRFSTNDIEDLLENPAYADAISFQCFLQSPEDILLMGLKEEAKRLNYNFHRYQIYKDGKQQQTIRNVGSLWWLPETFSLSDIKNTTFPSEKPSYSTKQAYVKKKECEQKPAEDAATIDSNFCLMFQEAGEAVGEVSGDLFYVKPKLEFLRKLLAKYYLKSYLHQMLLELDTSEYSTYEITRKEYDAIFERFSQKMPETPEAMINDTLKELRLVDVDCAHINEIQRKELSNRCILSKQERNAMGEWMTSYAALRITIERLHNEKKVRNLEFELVHVMNVHKINNAWTEEKNIEKMESKHAQNIATALTVFPDLSIYGTLSVLTTYAMTHEDAFNAEGIAAMNAIKILLGALFTGYYLLRIYEVHRIHDYKKDRQSTEMAYQQGETLGTINKEAWLLFTQVMIVSMFSGYPLSQHPTSSESSIIDPAMLAVSALSVAIAIPLVTAAYHRYVHDNQKVKPSHYATLALIGLVAGTLIYFIPSACDFASNTDDRVKGLLEGSVLDRIISAIAGIGFYFLAKSTSCATERPAISSRSGSPASSLHNSNGNAHHHSNAATS